MCSLVVSTGCRSTVCDAVLACLGESVAAFDTDGIASSFVLVIGSDICQDMSLTYYSTCQPCSPTRRAGGPLDAAERPFGVEHARLVLVRRWTPDALSACLTTDAKSPNGHI